MSWVAILSSFLLTSLSPCLGSPVGPSLNTNTAIAAAAGIAVAAKIAEDECDDVGVSCENII